MKRWEKGARNQQQQQQEQLQLIKASYMPGLSAKRGNKEMGDAAAADALRERFFGMSPLKLDEEAPMPTFDVDRGGFQQKGKAWFAATELQSDLVVEVDELKFHLHKFPLLSRSGRLNRLVFESRDTETDRIKLHGIPGGPEAFELAAKFCYGMPIDLNASNVAALRCVAEYLEMVEELEEGNLISKTEAFLGLVVLPSWKESLTVLLSCENLYPWAENLQIVRRCSESIAWKACTDPKGLNNWPTVTGRKLHASPAWYGMKDSDPPKQVPEDWWFEDVSMLCMEHFSKVIAGIKVKGMKAELVGAAIMCYALRWIPALSKALELKSKLSTSATLTAATAGRDDFSRLQSRSRLMIENIVGLLPPHKGAVSCKFLLHMLRIANMQNASSSCKVELEKRIGMQLEHATLSDLLIPSFSHTSETLYDVGLVQRIVEYFLAHEEDTTSPDKSPLAAAETPFSREKAKPGLDDSKSSIGTVNDNTNGKTKVAKLLDGYLAEVAHDPHLSLTRFQALAEALPVYSRGCHDGLYRAIDMYLKAHPTTNEHERKRLCKIMDCQRLSSDARFHASQNDRLPLRTVVQVLFSEHMKLKTSTYGYGARGNANLATEGAWDTAAQDIRALKKDIEKIREQFLELRTGYNHIKQDLEKLVKPRRRSSSSSWSCGWKKLGSTLASPRFFQHSWRDDVPSTPDIFRSRRWR